MHIYIYTGMRGRVSKNGDVRDYVCKLNCWKVDMINERLQQTTYGRGLEPDSWLYLCNDIVSRCQRSKRGQGGIS